MRSARHQLILLGLICQGLAWDDYLLPMLYLLAWALCLVLPSRPIRLPGAVEALMLVVGAVGAYFLGKKLGYSTHFALGHGLAVMQLLRLLRPLDQREKAFSLLISIFHLAVACTFLFDYRFLLILIGAVVLIPRAFQELSMPPEKKGESDPTHDQLPPGVVGPGLTGYLVILAVTVLLFLFFPRGLLSGGIRLPSVRSSDPGTLLDSVLDPSRSGGENSRRILFQLEGEKVGYLRCYTLTEFDGRIWTADQGSAWRRLDQGQVLDSKEHLVRKVRIKNPAFLGRYLPVDGRVVALEGSFFRNAFLTTHGVVEAQLTWTGPNNYYQYWIATNAAPEPLRIGQIARFLRQPRQSSALQQWLEQRLEGVENPYQQARQLERYLQRNFTYQLGAPELNRLNPTDDFVFNQKTGHCERFASTLAVLLRMKGIPSRVVIGYLPNSRNWISGWYDVRLRDAHAWTEAWFADRGWVQLDATPAATVARPSVWSDWLEELDYAWYSHVVNFDAPTQVAMAHAAVAGLGKGMAWMHERRLILILLAGGMAVLLLVRFRPRWLRRKIAGQPEQQSRVLAEHYYGRMLHLLEKSGLHRKPQQTPMEFLAGLREQGFDGVPLVETITLLFCATRYGSHVISVEEQTRVETALIGLVAFTRSGRKVGVH
jgi:hypothetical protein